MFQFPAVSVLLFISLLFGDCYRVQYVVVLLRWLHLGLWVYWRHIQDQQYKIIKAFRYFQMQKS